MSPSAPRASGAAWSERTPAPSRILPLRVRSQARVLTAPSTPWSEPTPAPSRILLARVWSLAPALTAASRPPHRPLVALPAAPRPLVALAAAPRPLVALAAALRPRPYRRSPPSWHCAGRRCKHCRRASRFQFGQRCDCRLAGERQCHRRRGERRGRLGWSQRRQHYGFVPIGSRTALPPPRW